MELDPDACYRALQTRDPRFDGRFFTGVQSTGIYCRPICPARTPKRANCVFLPCAAAAQEAGFRPCLRCRPESSPGTPAWAGTSTTVARGLRLIEGGALDTGDVAQLAERLGVGERHMRRLFVSHVGASPQAIALTRRVAFAKQLIDETNLSMSEIAFSAGFSSIRRFNDAILSTYGRSPRELRRPRSRGATLRAKASAAGGTGTPLCLRLPYRPPLDWTHLLQCLEREGAPSVMRIQGDAYLRTFRLSDAGRETVGRLRVRRAETGKRGEERNYLVAELEILQPGGLIRIADRLRTLFDLHADPPEIEAVLTQDTRLRRAWRARPGIRIPGCWDPFEFAVTTLVLGPRPSASGRRRLETLVDSAGSCLELPHAGPHGGSDWPSRLFPSPEALAGSSLAKLGLSPARTQALGELANAVASGKLPLDPATGMDAATAFEGLRALPGLDETTAQRIALRALGDPDAFPSGDASLRRAIAAPGSTPLTPGALARRAKRWQPWRGYAAMLLWE